MSSLAKTLERRGNDAHNSIQGTTDKPESSHCKQAQTNGTATSSVQVIDNTKTQREIPNANGYSMWSRKYWYNPEKKKRSKNEVERLNALLSKRDTKLSQYEQTIEEMKQLQQQNDDQKVKHDKELTNAKQQTENEKAENAPLRKRIQTLETQTQKHQNEIEALRAYKSRVLFVLILSWVCLPIFIGYWYQSGIQPMEPQADTINGMQHTIDQLHVVNDDLKQTQTKTDQSIQTCRQQVTKLDTTMIALKGEITRYKKDIKHKNANYYNLVLKCQTLGNEAGRVNDSEANSDQIPQEIQPTFDCGMPIHIDLQDLHVRTAIHSQDHYPNTTFDWHVTEDKMVCDSMEIVDDENDTLIMTWDGDCDPHKLSMQVDMFTRVKEKAYNTTCNVDLVFEDKPVFGIDLGTTYSCISFQKSKKNIDERRDTQIIVTDK
eukprot:14592_1